MEVGDKVKTCIVSSSSLHSSYQCRLDAKYNTFVSGRKWNVFNQSKDLQIIGDVLIPTQISKIKQGILENKSLIINISDQTAGLGRLKIEQEYYVEEIGSDKVLFKDADIMVSKLGMPKGYIYLVPQNEEYVIGSSEFIPYKVKNSKHAKFYLYLLLYPKLREAYACLENGKTPSHKRVNPNEFLKIKIPIFEEEVIEKSTKEIIFIEEKIQKLEKQIKDAHSIINEIFASEISFDEQLYNEFGKGMSYGTQMAQNKCMRISYVQSKDLSATPHMRCSVRANNNATKVLLSILENIPTRKVKTILTEEIHRGIGPKYVLDGDIPVVKTAHLKNGQVIISNEEFVSKEFFDNKERAHVKKGDILLASTGKPSIGKIDLYMGEESLFADGHISIIRIDEKRYNNKFFVYWFRCILGYFQIEKDYVGCTNQIEIYPEQIREFIVPDISLKEQEQIVKKIDVELGEQMDIIMELKKLREQIDEVIRKAINEKEC